MGSFDAHLSLCVCVPPPTHPHTHTHTQVLVHERPTNQPDHYNTGDPAEAGELLGYMRFVDWKQYCLAHLFTNRDFTSGLLGLANIASSNLGQTGGICSARELKN